MGNIAFVGLGNMGTPMALNLLHAGHRLKVFDRDPATIAKLQAAGAIGATSARNASDDAQFVITMLPNGRVVEAIYNGPDSLFDALPPDAILIDCSTIAPAKAIQLAEGARAKGFAMLDAPVSGGTRGAQDGTLSFMVGGSAETFGRAQPVLAAMGATSFHVGPNGSGQLAKVCNNMMAAILMVGSAEVLALGARSGLAPHILTNIMRKSTGCNFVLERWNPWPGVDAKSPASHGYQGGFQVGLMLKDLGLAVDTAQAAGAPIPLGAAARNLFALHATNGAENRLLDMSSIQRLYWPNSSPAEFE
ncbi:3-hydroxyisobutyrate dehydrogenase [Sphingomonas profundi]|uniref:3-hydroxyisobutyrate dehydrogenase n=1 Tax=Alterirhizorhabdus profundi TaxID=2681549 RepID=UPI0012E774CE|nr:3-hydroxyisobutyrate dehydrogenase [Sphingomonas profundi]